MAEKVAGEMYYDLDGQLCEIKRQLRQNNGYPYDPEMLKMHLQLAIEGKFQSCSRNWKVWKTIQIGTGLETADGFRRALKDGGFKMSSRASNIISKKFVSSISYTAEEIGLCVATTQELIGKSGILPEILAGIRKKGGRLCTLEEAMQLRLQYKDQPDGERILVAMEPIEDDDGDLYVFFIVRVGSDLWLVTDYDNPGYVWNSDYRWVFALRK